MKIRNIQIENFKNHKNTIITDCSDFHLLYGSNASGKTNFITAFKLIKKLGKKIENFDWIPFHGKNHNNKKIRILLTIEISEKDRRLYLKKFFNFSDQLINKFPNLLKWIFIEFTVLPFENPTHEDDNRFFLTRMDISGSKNDLLPILWKLDDDSLKLKIIRKGSINNSHKLPLIDPQKMMDSLEEQKHTANEILDLNSDFLQIHIINKFLNKLVITEENLGYSSHQYSSLAIDKRCKKIYRKLSSILESNKQLYKEINESLKQSGFHRNLDILNYIDFVKQNILTLSYVEIVNFLVLELLIFNKDKIFFFDGILGRMSKEQMISTINFLECLSINSNQVFVTSEVASIYNFVYKFHSRTLLRIHLEKNHKYEEKSAAFENPYLQNKLENRLNEIIDYFPKIEKSDKDEEKKLIQKFSREFAELIKIILEVVYANTSHESIRLKKEIEKIIDDSSFDIKGKQREEMMAHIIDSSEHHKKDIKLLEFRNKIEQKPIQDSIINGFLTLQENERTEFKSSFRYDVKLQRIEKEREWDIAKAVAGLANGKGGELFIGVSDEGEILGLENDYSSLEKKDFDGFEIVVRQSLIKHTKLKMVNELLKFEPVLMEGKEICKIIVSPGIEPIIYPDPKSQNIFLYYVRHGNSTKPYDNPNDFYRYWNRRNKS